MSPITIKTVGWCRSLAAMKASPSFPLGRMARRTRDRGCVWTKDPRSMPGPDGGSRLRGAKVAAASDMIVVLGGDGTLWPPRSASVGRGIHFVAVNLGGLGFLTAIKTEELYVQFERVLAGDYRASRPAYVGRRTGSRGSAIAQYDALNDMVLDQVRTRPHDRSGGPSRRAFHVCL